MSEEAIREDVEQEVENEEVETEEVETETSEQSKSPRETIMESIAQKQREEREQDLADEPEVVEQEEPEEPEAIQEDVEEEPEEDLVEVNVGGELRKVPKDEVLEKGKRVYQKDASADHKLEEAARRIAEIERREAEFSRMVETFNESQGEQVKTASKSEFAQALVEDEEAAATMFANLQSKLESLERETKSVAGLVVRNQQFISEQQQDQGKRLVSLFSNEFPDIAGVKELKDMANRRTAEIMRENPAMPKEDIVRQAGNDVREYLQKNLGYKPEQEDKKTSEPEQVKKKMPAQPKRGTVRQPAKSEPKPKTKSDIIAEMQQKRRAY